MQVKIDKSFQRDIKKIKNKDVLKRIATIIRNVQNAEDINHIKSLKKLTGFGSFYRIRIGDYRIGLIEKDKTIIFIRLLHRKDIYK